jgi:small-conductance mechanosensitive channel
MNVPKPRLGHAAIAAILTDMDRYLPSDTINRQDYRRCRTVYGLMNTAYRRVESSKNPEKEYKKLQDLEKDLRMRLNNLDAAKGIPPKMTQYLDELKVAVDDALARGVTLEFLIQGINDMLEDKPNAQPEPQPARVTMMPDTKYKKVRAELAGAQRKIQRLNEENNALMLKVKRLEMERDRASS